MHIIDLLLILMFSCCIIVIVTDILYDLCWMDDVYILLVVDSYYL